MAASAPTKESNGSRANMVNGSLPRICRIRVHPPNRWRQATWRTPGCGSGTPTTTLCVRCSTRSVKRSACVQRRVRLLEAEAAVLFERNRAQEARRQRHLADHPIVDLVTGGTAVSEHLQKGARHVCG